MNMRFPIFSAVMALAFSVFSNPMFAAGDIASGEKLSQTCLGCHGAPGLRNASPVYRVPMIGGQNAKYLVDALKAYKEKKRSHPTMKAQAASLSEQDMQDIAAYFENLNQISKPFTKIGAKAGEAKATTCAGCHGPKGLADSESAKNAGYPSLAGQYDDYLERALLDYKSGARENAIMSGFAQGLSKQDIKDLARWFRSQAGSLNAPVIKIKK
jgi:cytochrome c553